MIWLRWILAILRSQFRRAAVPQVICMVDTENPELRCGDCQQIGCECPKGYFGGRCRCDVCGYQFALAAAGCAPKVTCPECNGTVTYYRRKVS